MELLIGLIIGIVVGVVVAFVLNKLLANKLENKGQRIGLKVTAFIVCIILWSTFSVFGSLRKTLDIFIIDKIQLINTSISEAFPEYNIMEISVDSNEFILVSDRLEQITTNIAVGSNFGVFEKIVFDAFTEQLDKIVTQIQSGVKTSLSAVSKDGIISINAILYNLKDAALKKVFPYIIIGQTLTVILFIIFIGVYIGVFFVFRKLVPKVKKSILKKETGESGEKTQ